MLTDMKGKVDNVLQNRLEVFKKISLKYLEDILDNHTTEEIPPNRWTRFSWSTSRHHMFSRCLREYYLNYYGARRVREAKSKEISAVWWLKRLTSLKAWIGTTIHEVASRIIWDVKSGRDVDEEKYKNLAVSYYQRGVAASENQEKFFSPLKREDKGSWVLLDGHVYNADGFPDKTHEGSIRVRELMGIFFNSEAYNFIQSLPPQAIYEIDPPFQTFKMRNIPDMGDIPVFAIPDVLLNDGERITIVDWKTGDSTKEGIRLQAGVYRYYGHDKYNLPEELIDVVISALGASGENVQPTGGVPSLSESEASIHASIRSMVGKLNSIEHNTAAIRDFPMTDNMDLCHICPFRKACWREETSTNQLSLF